MARMDGGQPDPAVIAPAPEIQAYLFYDEKSLSTADSLRRELNSLTKDRPLRLHSVLLESDSQNFLDLGSPLPRLEIGPYVLEGEGATGQAASMYAQAVKRFELAQLSKDRAVISQFSQRPEPSTGGKVARLMSRHYLSFFLILLALYVGLPLAAPVMLKAGLQKPAELVYTLYKPLCHQLAFRSFFLFGEQAVYPRESAGVEGLLSYEAATGLHGDDLHSARAFLGDPVLGYKVALCERDMAIYGTMLLFGLIYLLSGKRIKGIHWALWLGFGLLPIALDGFSQLLSQTGLPILAFLPYRESTPALRVITGALFGWFTAWYGFPALKDVFEESKSRQARVEAILKAKSEVL